MSKIEGCDSDTPEVAPRVGRAGPVGSIAGVPDDGESVVIVLPGRAAEIGVERAGSEFGRGHREADIFALRNLAGANPATAELDAAGQYPIVGLLPGLATIGHDLDFGID